MVAFLRAAAWALLLAVAARPEPVVAQTFPYTAYTLRGGAAVRSGPGENFAATERLDRGSEIEVHRRDPGGWLAIRPPDGSFNWVAGDRLEVEPDGRFAAAKESGLAALVGSRLQGFRESAEWQVKLEQGETVEILGKLQVGETVWYKISPPAGDFRWIQEQLVARDPPPIATAEEEAIVENEPAAREPAATVYSPIELRPLGAAGRREILAVPAASAGLASSPSGGVQLLSGEWPTTTALPPAATIPVANGAPPLATPGDGFVPRRKEGEPRVASLPPHPAGSLPPVGAVGGAVLSGAAAGGGQTPVVRPNIVGDDQAAHELSLVDLELAFMLSQEPVAWNLAPLRARAEACNDAASAAQVRVRSREILQKLAEFEGIRQRHLQLNAIAQRVPAAGALALTGAGSTGSSPLAGSPPPVPSATSGNGAANSASESPGVAAAGSSPALPPPGNPPAATGAEPTEPIFDGEGWLMPVITRRTDVPPFAITDDEGRLVGFVTPAPGLNLERYKKQKIGVKGTRGFIDEFNKPHVTAERVKVLDTPKLR